MSIKQEVGLTAAQAAIVSTVDPVLLEAGFELLRQEKQVKFRQAWKQHWRAVLISCTLSLALVMDGYDGAIVSLERHDFYSPVSRATHSTTHAFSPLFQINSFYGLPAFVNHFGSKVNGIQTIPADWQTALSNIGLPGGFLGLAITGYCQEKYGSRKTYMGGMAATICVIFLFVFAKDLKMLLAAEALAACCWAMFSE